MAEVSYGEEGAALPGASYQTYLTLTNFNTITLRDTTAGGKAPVTNNPGDVFLPGGDAFDSDPNGRPYYQNIVGAIVTEYNDPIYDARDDGVLAEYEYILNIEYNTNYTGYLSKDVDAFIEKYDPHGTDQGVLDGEGLGSLILSDVINNPTELDQLVDAIFQAEGANNPIAVTWSAADSITIGLNNVTDVDIHDATQSGGQDTTELDLDSVDSTITGSYPIDWGGTLYVIPTIETPIENGSLIFSQNTIDHTATISSNISNSYSSNINQTYDQEPAPSFTLGSIDTDTFYHLGDGTTIFAGSSKEEFTITAGGDIVSNGDTVALPAHFLAHPTDSLSGTDTSPIVFVNGNSELVAASISGEILIGVGTGDELNAGTSSNVLIQVTGETGNYDINPNPSLGSIIITPNEPDDLYYDYYSYNGGVTEVVESTGTGPCTANNTLNAYNGDNILIGDSGNNTFNLNGYAVSTTNVVWGGGGTSTYVVARGTTIDVVYTAGTPTAAGVEAYADSLFAAGSSSNGPITYIIDPGANDRIVVNQMDPFYTAKELVPLASNYTPTFDGDGYFYNIWADDEYNMYSNGDGVGGVFAYNFGGGVAEFGGNSSTINPPWTDWQPGDDVTIEGFVNGAFGISFSGSAYLYPLLHGTAHYLTYGSAAPTPAWAYGSIVPTGDDAKTYVC